MTILPHEHEAQAKDDFAFAIRSHGATTNLVAYLDRSHVADLDGRAVLRSDDDPVDFFGAHRAAESMDEQHLAFQPDVAAADVAIVLLHRLDNLIEGYFVSIEALRIDSNLILLLEAAPAIDLGRAFDRAQFGLHDP